MSDGGTAPAAALGRAFFARPVLAVARDLLGRHVTHGGVTVRLSETEAYDGTVDPASSVLRRPTRHNAPVFGPPGHAFVYFTYGHHWMLCVVTGDEGSPEVVLLRAGAVVTGLDVAEARRPGAAARDRCRGPGRLTATLGVTGSLSGRDLCAPGSDLVVSAGDPVPSRLVRTGPRVGVRGEGGDGGAWPWRFWVAGDPTVSGYRAHPSSRRGGARP